MKKSVTCGICKHQLSLASVNRHSYQWLKCIYLRSPFSLRLLLLNMLFQQFKKTRQQTLLPLPASRFRHLHPIPVKIL
ncbi:MULTISPECIES: hypothetical protein [Tatumella]|uniref:InsA N-terminal domain-containing protein n=1 Tax=Tatumella punctata TaxID=399969 RepID=A0ABW1VM25_9GAMM|nr:MULTISPECIES: hypothetical protein [unclassified Tatumella]MBS0854677.1 hypothetical protein [Tatumella sp. JGM16]MBS0875948.1 hypothetical protein [Tatumella sp. JGM82]MBS0890353.1 hypothetical protein [Tatumella sp. JGM94]MBS0892541.1 hypothetical protein [Tatumella sp. JGM130]MBS0900479.1 hypothetical protein [Tatumella sp. JGM100]